MKRTPNHLRNCRADVASVLDFPFRGRGSSFSIAEVIPYPPGGSDHKTDIMNSIIQGSAVLGDVGALVSDVTASTVINCKLVRATVSDSVVVDSRVLYSTSAGSAISKSTLFESMVRGSSLLEADITACSLLEAGVVASSLRDCEIECASISGAEMEGVKLQASVWVHGGKWTRAPIYIEGPEFVLSECFGGRVHVGCWCVRPDTLYRHEALLTKIVGEGRVTLVRALLDELVRQIRNAPSPGRPKSRKFRRSDDDGAS